MRNVEFVQPLHTEKKSELSPDLLNLIEVAFSEYPELKNIKIETFPPEDDFDAGGYYEFEEKEDGTIIPKIFLSEGSAEMLRPLLNIRKLAVEINAKMLGIEPTDMTPKLLQYFIIAHELGHIRDFRINFESNPNLHGWDAVEEMAQQREHILSALPIPNISPTHLARELSGLTFEAILKKYPALRNYHNFSNLKSPNDVLIAQEKEYRSSEFESYADNFAAEFLKRNAEKLDILQLTRRKSNDF